MASHYKSLEYCAREYQNTERPIMWLGCENPDPAMESDPKCRKRVFHHSMHSVFRYGSICKAAIMSQ